MFCILCPGKIEGLPNTVTPLGNVFLIETNFSMQLSLRCRCSQFVPFWNKYEIESQTLHGRLSNNIQCLNTSVQGNETKCSDSLLDDPKPNIVLENSETFYITESTVLMCYSSVIRQTVVISMLSGMSSLVSI